ncbi:MAG TPA: GDSL-type esterase/lipase family protein [Hyphomicrobiaceae bacterium]|jgi:acyl-CoA thioesterase-1|nr:GDSL-type esterase/lipase family protein [Hyphomicrobiaceae bacterium]
MVAAALACCFTTTGDAQQVSLLVPSEEIVRPTPPKLSPDCRSNRIASDVTRRPLRAVSRALRVRRKIKILAIGSSTTVGVGASSPAATYVASLETTLEGSFKGVDFDVVGRGVSGEVAQGAADRMKKEIDDIKPDLVVWQVGTNDAIRHVSIEAFKTCLRTTLAWLAENKLDVVLVDPQYGTVLVADHYYEQVVKAIADVAKESGVLLVDRFQAMLELQRARGDAYYLSADNLHMNDRGHRCMAEQLARAIVGGLVSTDTDQHPPVALHQ